LIAQLLNTVGPVFLLVLFGYLAVRRAMFDAGTIDSLMRYAVRFAVPCLLFRAVSTLDLGAAYDVGVMASYYGAAIVCFAVGALAARYAFGRRPGEAVAVGFAGLFSNLVLLGLPVVTMALGEVALPTAYALASVHAPLCYLVGIVAMELLRADGRSLPETAVVIARTMFGNALMIGIGLGFLVNLGGVPVPVALASALGLVADSALPVALVGLGGTLARYTLAARVGETAAVTAVSLVLHPALALALCALLGVDGLDRSVVVLMASMSPGINVYLFAAMYGRAEDTAAVAVLLGTAAAVVSVSAWSWLLTSA